MSAHHSWTLIADSLANHRSSVMEYRFFVFGRSIFPSRHDELLANDSTGSPNNIPAIAKLSSHAISSKSQGILSRDGMNQRFFIYQTITDNLNSETLLETTRNISWNSDKLQYSCIGLTTKWLRALSLPPNDKVRNHLVVNPVINVRDVYTRASE